MLGKKTIVNIEGMHCSHCAKSVEESLKKIDNIKSVKVNLEKKNATITYKNDINIKDVEENIKELGFEFKGTSK